MLSILIPIFNEQESIGQTVRTLHQTLSDAGEEFELVIINDGSTDNTAKILSDISLLSTRVITHPYNRGYSASLKTGIRKSSGEIIGITDADGTYPVQEFPTLLKTMKDSDTDMVVGARTKKGVKIPLMRRPAKMIVGMLANTLTGMRIPDLNSGMRIFSRPLAERFMYLYPQRFSFTITITLAAITNDYMVEYVPIDYNKRTGKSTLSSGMNGPRNFVQFLGLILRITTSFRPLKFFMWPSILLTLGGVATIGFTLYREANVSDSGMLLLLTGIQIGLFGLLAEVVVRHRQGQ
jgi:glycosyltransferase involved in cell wall biosynthesis